MKKIWNMKSEVEFKLVSLLGLIVICTPISDVEAQSFFTQYSEGNTTILEIDSWDFYNDVFERERKLMQLIETVCPNCSTTSSGSTVKVTYSTSSGSQSTDATRIYTYDNSNAEYVVEYCERLLDDYYDADDIAIYDDNEDKLLAICYGD